MLTNEQADANYTSARAAIQRILLDPNATDEQKASARERRDALTSEFIGNANASIAERTAQFQAFIDDMKALIAEFERRTTVAGILELKQIVDTAGGLVEAATGAAPPAEKAMPRAKAPRKVAKKRSAPKPKAKAAKKKPARPARKASRKKGGSR